MTPGIAIVIPYFGSQPAWFEYFLHSCSYNANITWLFFTDCLHSRHKHPNLKFIPFTLTDFNQLATRKLGFELALQHTYKLCDLKPAYGHIFEDYLSNYEYFGYGDIDLVYGNILKFLPNRWNEKFDILANHSDFSPGHLCLLRNSRQITRLYRESSQYQRIFQSQAYWGFDEVIHPFKVYTQKYLHRFSQALNITYHLLFSKLRRLKAAGFSKTKNEKPEQQPLPIDFTSLIKVATLQGIITSNFTTNFSCDLMLKRLGYRHWQIQWHEGTCTDTNRNCEIMYFHFQLAKLRKGYLQAAPDTISGNFILTETGIQ